MGKLESGTRRLVKTVADEGGTYLRRKIVIGEPRDVQSGDLATTALHFESPETVCCRHVEDALASQRLGEPVARHQCPMVVGAGRDDTIWEFDRVVPGQFANLTSQLTTSWVVRSERRAPKCQKALDAFDGILRVLSPHTVELRRIYDDETVRAPRGFRRPRHNRHGRNGRLLGNGGITPQSLLGDTEVGGRLAGTTAS